MATFAIFYDVQDWQAIQDTLTNPGLTPQERQEANRYWQGGINVWSTAPTAPEAQSCITTSFNPTGNALYANKIVTNLGNGLWKVCDPNIRICVVSGTQVSKAGLVSFLRTIGNKYPAMLYMTSIADDIVLTGVEPWPPV